MIIEMNPDHPQPRKIQQVVDILKKGGLVAYPTDTVYGIGCDIMNRAAVTRLHKLVTDIKNQPEHSPLSFICKDISSVAEYAFINDHAHRIMRRLLPGPYTFVLEATKLVPKIMLAKRKTVGIRVPDSQITAAIVELLGNPITTTSATLGDGELIPDPWTIQDLYGHSIDAVIDGGYLFPAPSTVIDFTTDYPTIIRQGKGSTEGFEFVEIL